jgi:hypothetical protein
LCCVFVCLSSCCILCMVVSNTYCVAQHNMCYIPPYTRYNTKTNKQIHKTICVRYHHTQDTTQRQTNKYTVFVCLSSCCILSMAVSNTCCVVYLFVCLRVVSWVWWYLTHIVLHNTICIRYHHTQDTTQRQTNKYTTKYVLDTTIRKIQQEDKQTNTQHNGGI